MQKDLAFSSQSTQLRRMLIKKSALSGIFLLFALIFEIVTFLWIGVVLPKYFLLDLGVIFLFTLCIFVLPGFLFQEIVICVILFLQLFLSVVNVTLFSMSNMVFSFSMLNILGEAGNVFSAEMVDFVLIGTYVLLYALFIYLLVLVNKKLPASGSFVLHAVPMILFFYLLSALVSFGLYGVTKSNFSRADPEDPFYIFNDDEYLWETQFVTAAAYRKFGSYGFYTKNFVNFATGARAEVTAEELYENISGLNNYFDEGEWNSSVPVYDRFSGIMTGSCAGKNVVLVVIESGEWYDINPEYTPTLYALASQGLAMTNYYARDKTNHSEALSILGSYPADIGNSVIPSFSNPDGLLKNTLPFTSANILSERGYTTNYFHANDGSFYGRDLTHNSLYGFENTHFLETMDRLQGHYDKNGVFQDFDRDSEMISQYLDEFTKVDSGDQAYFTMMLSLISHGNYLDLVNNGDYTAGLSDAEKAALSEKYVVKNLEPYYEIIDGYPETYIDEKFAIPVSERDEKGALTGLYLQYKRHQAGIMDLDVGLNRLINDLKERGELENTVFLCYADHCSYYGDMQYPLKGVKEGEFWNTHLYNIPFFIWTGDMDLDIENIYGNRPYTNRSTYFTSVYDGAFYYEIHHDSNSGIGGKRVEKVCSSFDVLPTLLDLLGVDFNMNLYQGRSIFREGTNAFISRESGIFTQHLYFDSETLYMDAERQENGDCVSYDGQIVLHPDGSVETQQLGSVKEYSAEEVLGSVYSDADGKYLFVVVSEGEEFLSDSATMFLLNVNQYYERQQYLENMYRYDYFAYADIHELIR